MDLSVEQRNAVSRISGLVLSNAMIFQEVLAKSNSKVKPLQHILEKENVVREFCTHWKYIIDNINYYPIFHIAREILLNVSSSKSFTETLFSLANTAQEIVGMRAALRHDLMGRIYHRLLVDKKYLGTYYTSIPAATLLLKLSLQPSAWNVEWHKLSSIRKLQIADIACGTGTLLMAAADAITDNYVSAVAEHGAKIETTVLQNMLAEDVIYGYDVLASAIHLTASTLALRAPEVAFTKMNLCSLPLGGTEGKLGSIEYLIDKNVGMSHDLFRLQPTTKRVKGKYIEKIHLAVLPDLDLCVMNPPFTRSVGHNLLFGSLPEPERKKAQDKLKMIVRTKKVSASITAGLGSVFVATAHPYIKEGGRMALVLPRALLSGVAWQRTRELISKSYDLEYILSSHDPERWNFSESTSLSEVLVVARKQDQNNCDSEHRVVAVNLWRNPTTIFEAQAIGHSLLQRDIPYVEHGQGALKLNIGDKKIGEAISIKWSDLRHRSLWMLPCAFAQSDLIRVTYHLLNRTLWIPGYKETTEIPLCSLDELATIGPDRRDIHDGFELSDSRTSYPTFWGHNSEVVFTLTQEPNRYLSPLSKAKKGRSLRKVEQLWPKSARVLIAERLRLNTCHLVAVRTSIPVLSNVWWPIHFNLNVDTDRLEKFVTLWLNSSLGLLTLLAHREETEGAWIDLKKPVLEKLPVPDLRILSPQLLQQAVSTFDKISKYPLLTLPQMDGDLLRAEIDSCIAKSLEIPDFSVIRRMLSREPVVCLRQL